ncbi:TPA: plasmid segregation protein ParM domain-containing protein [Aeromonas hydrophila]
MSTNKPVIKQQEPQVEVPFIHVVAVDDGSGNIAVAYENEAGDYIEHTQPSLIERGVGAAFGQKGVHAWSADGERYTIKAYTTNPISTLEPDYQVSAPSRVLVNDAFARAGLGGKLCSIGCTLPVDQYYMPAGTGDDPRNWTRIKAKEDNLKKAVQSVNGSSTPPTILHVSVYPEAIPAYIYCAYAERPDEDREEIGEYPERHKTLVVDLGEFTNDLAILATGNEVVGYATHEHGVHRMVEHFRTLLIRDSSKLGLYDITAMPAGDLKLAIERGYIGSDLSTPAAIAARIDVTSQINEAANELNRLLLEDIRTLTRGQLSTMTRVVFVGGGANLLREHAKQWHHAVDIPLQPESAIVRGVYLLLSQERESMTAAALEQMEATADEQ